MHIKITILHDVITLTLGHGRKNIFVHKYLKNSTHIFRRKEHMKKPLEIPYDGPIKILDTTDRTFTL